jgi:hypothetical protein
MLRYIDGDELASEETHGVPMRRGP